jgi:hypothetical protein
LCFLKKIIALFGISKKIISLFVISSCSVCVLLNLNLAPTCITDYLVFCCCFHRPIRNEEFNRNSINLHICFVFSFFLSTNCLLILTNDGVKQGFSTFRYLRIPQINILPLCLPPNQSCIPFAYPQIKILPMHTLCKLLLSGF